MPTYFDFDVEKLLKELKTFNDKFLEHLEEEMEEMEEAIREGKLKGKWDFEKIDEPSVKGYIIRGSFKSDHLPESLDLLDPLDPFRSSRRSLTPERPAQVSTGERREIREPLTEIFEEGEAIELYILLPGEEKKNIQLNVAEGRVEVKAKKFYKQIDLPIKNIDPEKISAKYNNGTLKIIIPKSERAIKDFTLNVKIE